MVKRLLPSGPGAMGKGAGFVSALGEDTSLSHRIATTPQRNRRGQALGVGCVKGGRPKTGKRFRDRLVGHTHGGGWEGPTRKNGERKRIAPFAAKSRSAIQDAIKQVRSKWGRWTFWRDLVAGNK